MPTVVAWVAEQIAFYAQEAAAAVANAVAPSLTVGQFNLIVDAAYNVAYFGVQAGIYIGAAEAMAPSLPKADAGKFNIRQTMAPRRDGFGRARLGGGYLLWESANNFYDVIYLCEGPIDGFEYVYFNDDLIQLDGSGRVQDTFVDHRYHGNGAWVFMQPGAATATSFADPSGYWGAGPWQGETYASLGAGVWTTAHRADGCATLAVIGAPVEQQALTTTWPNGSPQANVVTRLRRMYDWRDNTQSLADPTTWKWSRNPVVALAWYKCFSAHGPQDDFTTRIQPSLAAWTTAANVCDEQVPVVTASSQLSAHAAKGATSVTLFDTSGLAAGSTLYLNDPGESHTVSGVSGLTVTLGSGLTWPHNPGAPAAWAVAAGQTVNVPRYAIDGTFTYDNTPDQVETEILKVFDGWMGEQGDGSLIVYAGKYVAPTVTIDYELGHVVGFSYRCFVPDEEAVNELVISYTSSTNQYSQVQCDPWTDDTDISLRGVVRSERLDLPWVEALSQARRLAKRVMARKQAAISLTVTTNLWGFNCLNQRYLGLNIPLVASLTNVVVEVTKPPKLDLEKGQVAFTCVLADANIDAWNPATEEGASPVAPNTAAPNLPTDPTIVSITPFFTDDGTAGVGVQLEIVIADPQNASLTYATRWQVAGQASWVQQSFNNVSGDGTHVTLITGFVTANATLNVQVQYGNSGGVSDWSPTTPATVDTSTASVAPGEPTINSESGAAGGYTIAWRNPSSSNFNDAKVWRAAHGAAFSTATDDSGARPDSPGSTDTYTATGIAAGTWDLWVTAENASGTASPPAGPVTVTTT